MAIDDMLSEIFFNLKAEYEADEAQAPMLSDSILMNKVKGAYREIRCARRYPASYDEEKIARDLMNFYSNIENLARYDYNKIGAEGLSSYRGDGVSMSYVDRNKFFYGVYPISRKS